MRKLFLILTIFCGFWTFSSLWAAPEAAKPSPKQEQPTAAAQKLTADEILKAVDANTAVTSAISISTMTVEGERGSRAVKSKNWRVGVTKSFSEYLEPAREKGTKMLKLNDELWTYYPDADRIVKIAGHMLRQSVMGSDLSYEDMMENRKLIEMYTSKIIHTETLNGHNCWVLELTSKLDDVAYPMRKLWVDTEKKIPIRTELYAKSGKLLKFIDFEDFKKIGERWYPIKMLYKDVFKDGKGTKFAIDDIQLDANIPDSRFSKSSLAK